MQRARVILNWVVVLPLLGSNVMAVAKKNKLTTYRTRRNVKKSGEPAGKVVPLKKGKKPIFVVQLHHASHIHYDFRLEIGGVLVSWAVPKGPSLNPRIKRLAVQTDDHPMDYADFEGVIPEGNYGAGKVLVWDTGTFTNIKHDHEGNLVPLSTCLKQGTLEFTLKGKKLQGGFALVRTHYRGDNNWLLIKLKDEYADARRNVVTAEPLSVKSGKSIKEII